MLRRRIYWISSESIAAHLNGRPSNIDLLPDAELVNVHWDDTFKALGLMVESENFDPVPEGSEPQFHDTDRPFNNWWRKLLLSDSINWEWGFTVLKEPRFDDSNIEQFG